MFKRWMIGLALAGCLSGGCRTVDTPDGPRYRIDPNVDAKIESAITSIEALAPATSNVVALINPALGGLATVASGLLVGLGRSYRTRKQELAEVRSRSKAIEVGALAAADVIDRMVKGRQDWTEARQILKKAKRRGAIMPDELG